MLSPYQGLGSHVKATQLHPLHDPTHHRSCPSHCTDKERPSTLAWQELQVLPHQGVTMGMAWGFPPAPWVPLRPLCSGTPARCQRSQDSPRDYNGFVHPSEALLGYTGLTSLARASKSRLRKGHPIRASVQPSSHSGGSQSLSGTRSCD